jgi:hypothetical protein
MKPKINWKSHPRYSIFYGFIAGVKICEIEYENGNFQIRFFIGPQKIMKKSYPNIEEAKQAAQMILKTFLGKIEYEE